MDPTIQRDLRAALFDVSLPGIARTGEVFMLGGFLLVAAMVDMLAGLRWPGRDSEQPERYADFVGDYFPPAYARLGATIYRSLRCEPLHNFSSKRLLLADNQPHLHHSKLAGRTVLHWPETLRDYEHALHAYWQALEGDATLQANAERRCKTYPPMSLIQVPGGATFPLTFPLSFGTGGGSAWGGRLPPQT
jgi:hypothetical protein